MGNILAAGIRHYPGQDLSIIKLPAPVAMLRDYLGSIVEADEDKSSIEGDNSASG